MKLSRLIEQISGSLELVTEYEKAKGRATESATFNVTKRRGIVGEIKQYKEQQWKQTGLLCQVRGQPLLDYKHLTIF